MEKGEDYALTCNMTSGRDGKRRPKSVKGAGGSGRDVLGGKHGHPSALDLAIADIELEPCWE